MKKIITLLLILLPITICFAQTNSNANGNVIQKEVVDGEKSISKPVEIYPNPTTESFCIYNINDIVPVEIYSVNGKMVQSQNVSEGEIIYIGHLPNGIYLVKINKQVYKVIKK